MQTRALAARAAALSSLTLMALFVVGHSPGAESRSVSPALVTCADEVLHPIQIQLRALDPVARGAAVRLQVEATSSVDLERADVRIVDAGGAEIIGSTRETLGSVRPGRSRAAELSVRVPPQGRRFLVQFQVRGEGPNGILSRGASFQLLPDGPAERARIVTTAAGERIAEYPARRIER